ncbi:hypothetical protein G9F73_009015 [Clostridium estertheticum]|uniref:hypothetical protein n=1 Tax=Clostridium estertheticum TaxID=238834 RepID=UPI001CC913DF|nr:hypothetical protein [Clostridium estertheticum]MBZ9607945.1 hypothetical protein [Clostridium estertheticum]
MGNLYVEEFNPKRKKYYYNNCTKDFCYKTKNGICSFDLTEDEVRSIPTEEYPGKDNVNYCRNIYKSLIKNRQQYPIYISSNKCDHYTFNDGQHRTCIANKKGLKLKAEVSQNDEICHVCYRENSIQNSIRSVENMVKQTTPRKTIFDKIKKIDPQSNFQGSLDKWKKDLSDYQLEKERDFREF